MFTNYKTNDKELFNFLLEMKYTRRVV